MDNEKYNAVIDELIQGMEKANELKFHLNNSAPLTEAQELLLKSTIRSYEKALTILGWDGTSTKVDGSLGSDDLSPSFKDSDDCSNTPKKRKLNQPTWTKQVRAYSENGLEGPTEDGFSWRKYGQKDILGAKYPRSYYRCTYRALRNCWATKQVQRSDEDSSIFEVTYKGTHKCDSIHLPPPAARNNAAHKYGSTPYIDQPPKEHNQNQANLKLNQSEYSQFSFPCQDKEESYFPIFPNVEDGNFTGAYADVFLSPATSGSDYFSSSAYQMAGIDGLVNFRQPESSSGHASTSNSPICGIDFTSETSELNPNFRF